MYLAGIAAQSLRQPLDFYQCSGSVNNALDIGLAILELLHVPHDVADLPEGAANGASDV